jgi:lipoprotein-anchoring transpeptidase ErfK/SrfK
MVTLTVFCRFPVLRELTERGSMGTSRMDARFAARMATGLSLAIVAVAGLGGEAFGQYYPPGAAPYPAPPPGYRTPLPPEADNDALPPPPPGYGRPAPYSYESQQRPPAGIQSEALPPPGGYQGGYQGGGAYQDGGLPPPTGRGYTYGAWEPVRPPAGYGPSGALPPAPGLQPPDDAARPPMEITPPSGGAPPPAGYQPPAGGYPAASYAPPPSSYPPADVRGAPAPGGIAGLPPEDQPETGQPKELPPQFRRQMVDYATTEPAGTIIIDTPNTYLYLVLGGGKAMRYGIGVGREGFTWAGREKISRMAEWPDWHPPSEMIDRQPYLPRFMAGGESNPLGARAMYLGATLYRIHGTNQPSTIGSFVSSGCIRLTNADVEDLYSRVTVGTKVVVLPGGNGRRAASAAPAPGSPH